MFCISCGREVESGDKFCPYCGTVLEENQEETVYLANQEIQAEIQEEKTETYQEQELIPERDIQFEEQQLIIKQQEWNPQAQAKTVKKWQRRLLTGLLITAVVVLAVNIAVGVIYLRQLERQDDNYELPELNITEMDNTDI